MSGAITATTILAGAAVAGTVAQIQQGKKAAKSQEQAARQAVDQADKQAKMADEANNRANKKKPNVGAMLDANMQASQRGAGSTMLTGPGGVDPSSLTLGKSTLLGQ
jgi:Ni/Co efflux regulator RcnB